MQNNPQTRNLRIGALLAIALTLALLPVGLLASFQALQNVKRLQELERVAVHAEARTHVIPVRERFNEIIGKTQTLGNLVSDALIAPDLCRRSIAAATRRDDHLLYAGILLSDGTRVCTSGPDEFAFQTNPAIETTDLDRGYIIEIATTQAQTQAVHIGRPITGDGGLNGWLLSVWSADIFKLSPDGDLVSDVAIIDRFGQHVALTDAQRFPSDLDFEALQNRHGEIIQAKAKDSTNMLYMAFPIAGRNLLALSGVALDDHAILNRSGLIWTFALPMLMWAASLVVAVTATNRLTIRPIHNLTKMTRAMRFGIRDVTPMKLKGAPSEFQTLSDSFVEMANRVAKDEALLEQSVVQKSALVKEVHHRVRNNLQLLVSILNMQEREAGSPDVKTALDQFRQRVLGLSAVYERIYEGDDFTQKVSSSVVDDVITVVSRSEKLSSRQVTSEIAPISLAQEKAVPLAMFVSEALAYLIHGSDTPQIAVSFQTEAERRACLRLSNQSNQDTASITGLAEKLLKVFALQLDGALDISQVEQRTVIQLTFETDTP